MVEIILKQFNIEDAISAAVSAPNIKEDNIKKEREQAQERAEAAITDQLKKELDTYLDADFQQALRLKVVAPSKLDVYAAHAVLIYNNYDFAVGRDEQSWRVQFPFKTINCTGEELQKTILVELATIREQLANPPEPPEELPHED